MSIFTRPENHGDYPRLVREMRAEGRKLLEENQRLKIQLAGCEAIIERMKLAIERNQQEVSDG